ncbi:hypothetical protein TrRE_jg9961, partial [Triparma retinervis]
MASLEGLADFLDDDVLTSMLVGSDASQGPAGFNLDMSSKMFDLPNMKDSSSSSSSSTASVSSSSAKTTPSSGTDSPSPSDFEMLSEPIPSISSTSKSSLSFWNNSHLPEICNPQVPKKIHLRLKSFPSELGQ